MDLYIYIRLVYINFIFNYSLIEFLDIIKVRFLSLSNYVCSSLSFTYMTYHIHDIYISILSYISFSQFSRFTTNIYQEAIVATVAIFRWNRAYSLPAPSSSPPHTIAISSSNLYKTNNLTHHTTKSGRETSSRSWSHTLTHLVFLPPRLISRLNMYPRSDKLMLINCFIILIFFTVLCRRCKLLLQVLHLRPWWWLERRPRRVIRASTAGLLLLWRAVKMHLIWCCFGSYLKVAQFKNVFLWIS